MEWNILATPKFQMVVYHKHTYIKHYLLEIKHTNTTERKILSSTSFADLHPKAFTKGTLGSLSQDDKLVWIHRDQIGDTQRQEERKDCFTHTCQNTLWKDINDNIFLFLSPFLLSGQDKCAQEGMTETDNWSSRVCLTDSLFHWLKRVILFVNHTTAVRLFVHFLHAAIEHKPIERWVALFYFTLHRPLNSN